MILREKMPRRLWDQTSCPEVDASGTAGKRFRPAEAPGKGILQPDESPVGYAVYSGFPALCAVTYTGEGFGDRLSLSNFCSL